MKHKSISLLLILLIGTTQVRAQLEVIEYQLKNGLTVILNPDPFQQKISGAVAVNTGSKNDPEDATGISHYLEHLLFKGTKTLGTWNYEKEKPHLDSIVYFYDRLAEATEADERKLLQKKINEQAVKASQYAMPNEFDKLLRSTGSTGINATTNRDLTIYYNDFPPNQLKKWLELYAHRFEDPVFRSFQSELEVVYEEKNRAADNMERRVLERFNQAFYKDHPYGDKSVLGDVEHLKNPSLTKMYQYFETYYVPNNMALILSGNFNPEVATPLIKEAFSKLEAADLPNDTIPSAQAFEGRMVEKERMTPVKAGLMGFRTVPLFHEDKIALDLISSLLQNESETGLIDQLVNQNKLMAAFIITDFKDEAGEQVFVFVPKIFGQSLKKAESLVLNEIEKLKQGEFSDALLQAVKNEQYKAYLRQLENVSARNRLFADLFRKGKSWVEMKDYADRIETVSKADVMRIANKYFGKDYMVLQSRTGFPKKVKLDKPNFQAVSTDQSKTSEYSSYFNQLPETKVENRFIDFEKDLSQSTIEDSSRFYWVKNPINDIYELNIRFHRGILADPELEVLAEFMDFAHPENSELSAFKEKIALLGSTYSFDANSYFFDLKLYGIEKNMDEILGLVNELIERPKVEAKSMKVLYNQFKTDRKIEAEDVILIAKAMAQYGLYGDKAVLLQRPSLKSIKRMDSEGLLKNFGELKQAAVSIHYSGQLAESEIKQLVTKNLKLNYNGKSLVPYYYPLVERENNEVYVLDNKKLVQSNVFMLKNSLPFQLQDYPKMELFNTYFGGGFSGVLKQEIREYRSLAYSTSAQYDYTAHPNTDSYFFTYLACQADKTNEAVMLAHELLKDMPKKPERMPSIISNVKLNQRSKYPSFRELSAQVEAYQLKGLNKDPNAFGYSKFDQLNFSDMYGFYESHIQKQATFLSIYGDADRFNEQALNKIGEVKRIKLEDVITF